MPKIKQEYKSGEVFTESFESSQKETQLMSTQKSDPRTSISSQCEGSNIFEKDCNPILRSSTLFDDPASELSFLDKNTQGKVALKDRRDVVNKSLIRAIKKFFCLKFKSEHPQPRFRTQYKRAKHFEYSIQVFAEGFYEDDLKGTIIPEDQSKEVEVLASILGRIVNPKMTKKTQKSSNDTVDTFAARIFNC